jgi:hypothetical protein
MLHSFIRDSSSSPASCPIQPLQPELLEATPLAVLRKVGETARHWKLPFP